jgi:hypothetical protein
MKRTRADDIELQNRRSGAMASSCGEKAGRAQAVEVKGASMWDLVDVS